MRRRRRF